MRSGAQAFIAMSRGAPLRLVMESVIEDAQPSRREIFLKRSRVVGFRRSPSLKMIAMNEVDRSYMAGVETCATFELRRGNLREGRRL